ncbi:MAG: hypothetical protein J0M05_03850 [Candidatus Kapabacteria bacterium]|nr:hypothetical protein [Candidatus Kapabacteria bacterium]
MKSLFQLLLCVCVGVISIQSYSYALSPSRQITQCIHDNWSVQDGLPPGMVTSLTQSKDGYLWLGTFGGLVRYDGARFTIFDKSNQQLQMSDKVFALTATNNGIVYFATAAGLFSMQNTIIKPIKIASIGANEQINKLYTDKNNVLWIGTSLGLLRKENSTIQRVHSAQQLPRGFRYSLAESTDGSIFIGTPDGVMSYRNGKASRIESQYFQGLVTALAVDNNNSLWIGTNSGLGRKSIMSEIVITSADGLAGDVIQTLFTDSDGNVWIGTNQGLSRASATGIISSAPRTMFPADVILSIYEDKEKNIWIGTFSNGLHRLRDGTFTTLSSTEGLSDDFTRSILQTKDGALWIGASNGLNRFYNNSITFYSYKNGLIGNEVNALCESADGSVWIGAAPGYITQYKNGKFIGIPISPENSPDPVYSLFEDSNGILWIGSENSLLIMKNGQVSRISTEKGLLRGLYTNISQDNNGTLWFVAYGGGLVSYSKGNFTSFTKKDGLPTAFVKSVFHTNKGELLLGTDGNGIIRRTKDNKFTSITKKNGLPQDDIFHIASDNAGQLWCSTSRGIFSCSLSDIEKLNSESITLVSAVNYGTRDGLLGVECNSGFFPAGWTMTDGTMCFPTVKGVAFVNPQKGRKNKIPPPVIIENYSVNGESPILISDDNVIQAGIERIAISYTALSLVAPEKIRFKYMLEGFDNSWVEYGNERTVYFTNLAPGSYTLKIIACNNDGVWNNVGATATFVVLPFFWQTLWFKIILGLLACIVLYGIYVLRVRSLQKKQRELERIVEERTNDLWNVNQSLQLANNTLEKSIKEIAALNEDLIELNNEKNEFLGIAAHDLKNPLSGIMLTAKNVQSFIHALKPDDIKNMMSKVETSAHRMRDIIGNLLDVNAIESGKLQLKPEKFDIATVIESICQENDEKAKEKNIILRKNISSHHVFADKAATHEIIDNLLSNAIKFSPFDKEIFIITNKNGNAIVCEIKDQGPGLTEEDMKKVFGKFARLSARPTGGEHSTGLGLSIVKRLAESMKGKVWCESIHGQGASFFVGLPQ